MRIKHNYADDDRRFKIIYLQSHVLLNCLINTYREPSMCCTKVSLDVPEDTVIVDRYYDFSRAAEGIVLYNKIWKSVPLSESIPQLYTTYNYVTVNMTEPNKKTTQPITVDMIAASKNCIMGRREPMKPDPAVDLLKPSDVERLTKATANVASSHNPDSSLHIKYDPEKQQTEVTNTKTGASAIIKDIHQMRHGVVQSLEFDPSLGVPHDIPNETRMAKLNELHSVKLTEEQILSMLDKREFDRWTKKQLQIMLQVVRGQVNKSWCDFI